MGFKHMDWLRLILAEAETEKTLLDLLDPMTPTTLQISHIFGLHYSQDPYGFLSNRQLNIYLTFRLCSSYYERHHFSSV